MLSAHIVPSKTIHTELTICLWLAVDYINLKSHISCFSACHLFLTTLIMYSKTTTWSMIAPPQFINTHLPACNLLVYGNPLTLCLPELHPPVILFPQIEIECPPHKSFWHLKLCLIDGLFLKKYQLFDVDTSPTRLQSSASNERRSKPLVQLVVDSIRSRRTNRNDIKSCMLSTTSAAANNSRLFSDQAQYICEQSAKPLQCDISTPSLSSSETRKSESTLNIARSAVLQHSDSSRSHQFVKRSESSSSPAFYYGFGGPSQVDWESDNGQADDLLSEEHEVVESLKLATRDSTGYANSETVSSNDHYSSICNAYSYNLDDVYRDARQINDLLEIDKFDDKEFNIYESLNFGNSNNEHHPGHELKCDRDNINVNKTSVKDRVSDNNVKDDPISINAIDRKLFEQTLNTGYLNYGFYSFSLAKFIDDQSSLRDYLTIVSSSTGTSYYLDLEFKLKQRQQISSLTKSSSYELNYYGSTHLPLHTISNNQNTAIRLKYGPCNGDSTKLDVILLKLNRLSSSNSSFCRVRRTNSVTTIGTNESRGSLSSSMNVLEQHSFKNNMIAKLASSSNGSSQKTSTTNSKATRILSTSAAASTSSSQCKRRRSKLLDLLLGTNWSKQSQQASGLNKLNKALLICDANFLDDKSGESPLSLVISSSQINSTPISASNNRAQISGAGQSFNFSTHGCPQSTSLFNLQIQHPTTSYSQLTLQQTSAADIIQSKAPLVEKILLLLIKSGALIDFRNNDGRTPLHVAAMKSNFWALKTLLDLGE